MTVTSTRDGDVVLLTMDDGKANAYTLEVFAAIVDALDHAETDQLAVVLSGREGRFSAGFDLGVLGAGDETSATLVRSGFEMLHRMLAFGRPLVVACTGHAYAMGAFTLLSADHRIGVAGTDHRITANEVAIGLTMPRTPIEICRARLTPAAFEQVVVLAQVLSHDEAVAAGFLDALAPSDAVVDAACAKAAALAELPASALAATKRRVRARLLDAVAAAIEADDSELRSRL